MSHVPGPPYGWNTLPASFKHAALGFVSHVAGALGDNLAGIYLHGSLGRACYHPATSDIDLLIVLHGACDDAVLDALASYRLPGNVPVHADGMTRKQLRCDRVPTPAEFEIHSEGAGEHALRVRRVTRGRGHLLLVRQDAYDCDTTLLGLPGRDVVIPVPWEALSVSLEQFFPQVVPYFKNPVLMLCRICYVFTHHSLCSKVGAGEWAMRAFGVEWRDDIAAALAKYREGIPDNEGETLELRTFEEFCRQYIERAGRNGVGL